MEEMLNQVVLLLSNGLATYIIYRFMHVFFEKRAVGKKTAIVVYALQYVISAFVLVWIPYPVLNVFIALLCYGMIVWCYEGSVRKRIVVAVLGYLAGFLAETIVMFIVTRDSVPIMEKRHFDVYITIVIQWIIWIIVLFLERKLKNTQKKDNIPCTFVVAVVAEMALIIILEFLIFQQDGINSGIRIASMLVVTFILLLMVYLYTSLSAIAEERTKNQMIEKEKDYYHNQAELLQSNDEDLRAFRHDIKNKMLALYELLDKNEIKRAVNYLQELTDKIEKIKNYSQSGNIVIDSVVNYKLSLAEKQGDSITAEVSLPGKIPVEDDDLVVVLGNLLDNAIEATKKLETNKYIYLKIKYDRECLIVKIENSFDNHVIVKKEKLQTRKENHELHGIGLQSVGNIVDKYHGDLNIVYKENIFSVMVLLYSENRQ